MLGHSCQTSTVIIFDLHLPFFLSVLFSFLFSVPLLFQPYLVALDHLLLGHQFSDCLAFLFLCVFLSWVSFYFIVFCDLPISILNFWSLVWGFFFISVITELYLIHSEVCCYRFPLFHGSLFSYLLKSLILIFSASLVTLHGFSTPFPVCDYLHIKIIFLLFLLNFFLVDLSYLLMSF